MEERNRRATEPEPAEGNETSRAPQVPPSREPKEGSYRDAETTKSNPGAYDDAYEVEQEEEITNEEARTEDENNT